MHTSTGWPGRGQQELPLQAQGWKSARQPWDAICQFGNVHRHWEVSHTVVQQQWAPVFTHASFVGTTSMMSISRGVGRLTKACSLQWALQH